MLSQSSLQDYVDCPRRFFLRHVEELDFPSVESEPTLDNEIHRRDGQDFHQQVERYWLGLPANPRTGDAGADRVARWWNSFLKADFGLQAYDKRAEFTLSASLGGTRLIAKYDLVASLTGQRVVIFDWKTYSKLPRADWLLTRLQTTVYRALMVVAGASAFGGVSPRPEQVELVYWFAEYPHDTIRLPYDRDRFVLDWDRLTRLATELSAAVEFPMTSHLERCAVCGYRSYCSRGAHAAEAELDTEPSTIPEWDTDPDETRLGGP